MAPTLARYHTARGLFVGGWPLSALRRMAVEMQLPAMPAALVLLAPTVMSWRSRLTCLMTGDSCRRRDED
jgi:hypothetical protein